MRLVLILVLIRVLEIVVALVLQLIKPFGFNKLNPFFTSYISARRCSRRGRSADAELLAHAATRGAGGPGGAAGGAACGAYWCRTSPGSTRTASSCGSSTGSSTDRPAPVAWPGRCGVRGGPFVMAAGPGENIVGRVYLLGVETRPSRSSRIGCTRRSASSSADRSGPT